MKDNKEVPGIAPRHFDTDNYFIKADSSVFNTKYLLPIGCVKSIIRHQDSRNAWQNCRTSLCHSISTEVLQAKP